jgi:hypothetical protein
MTMTTTIEITEAQQALDELRSELASIDDSAASARRAGDMTAWGRAISRSEALPGEIRAARLSLLPMLLDAAWSQVEGQQRAAVVRCAAALESEEQILAELDRRPQDREWFARQAAERVDQFHKVEAARHEWDQARQALGLGLVEVERYEVELEALTGEPIEYDDESRRKPSSLARNVGPFNGDTFGMLGDQFTARYGYLASVPAGTVPPRWLTLFLPDKVFVQPTTDTFPGTPSAEQIARAAARRAELDALDLGEAARVGHGRNTVTRR